MRVFEVVKDESTMATVAICTDIETVISYIRANPCRNDSRYLIYLTPIRTNERGDCTSFVVGNSGHSDRELYRQAESAWAMMGEE